MGKVNSVQFLEYSGGCGGRGSGQYSVVVGEVCSMLCSVKYVWWSAAVVVGEVVRRKRPTVICLSESSDRERWCVQKQKQIKTVKKIMRS